MCLNDMRIKKAECIVKGKAALDAAQIFLQTHADNWNTECEETWRNLIHSAETQLGHATFIQELIDDREQ